MDIQTVDEEITETGIYSKNSKTNSREDIRSAEELSKEGWGLVTNLGELAGFKEDGGGTINRRRLSKKKDTEYKYGD